MQATAGQILNISELAAGFSLKRDTVSKRLRDAGIAPFEKTAHETRYRIDDQLEAVLLACDADLEQERLRKLSAEADLKEMAAAQLRGELAPVREFQEVVQSLFGGMHKEIAVRFPKKIAARIARMKTAAEVSAFLQHGLNEIFMSVRNDFSAFLAENNGKLSGNGMNAPKKARNRRKMPELKQKSVGTGAK